VTVPFGGVKFVASQVAAATGGHLVGPDVALDGASFDSRSLRRGQLFVPIVAERDGHEFIDGAIAAGAPAYLTSRPGRATAIGAPDASQPGRGATAIEVPDASQPGRGATAIEVPDTLHALLDLGRWGRRRLPDRVVGITGSVGKTSTKDLVAAALRGALRVAANERSFNNDQGLPVTILEAPDDTQLLVLEMGMRGFGEITRLCDVGMPTIGVVTAVGESHTERVGGIEGVAIAKRELVEALPPSGTAILNGDDPRVLAMGAHTAASVISYGSGERVDVRITSLELDEVARPTFDVSTPWGPARVRLAVSGEHMARNALAALAVAGVVGVPLDVAAAALGDAQLSAMRMDVRRAPSGMLVVNDAYNANPTSMRAALDSLAAMRADRRVAIVGMMAELDDPAAAHPAIAAYARARNIELIPVGTELYGVAPVDDPRAALGDTGSGTVVLVKASRVGGLERLARQLLDEEVAREQTT
jgi:UDP-N-acetylmuramoyl-tripeptide--D-alanyl-D-alanine ligase